LDLERLQTDFKSLAGREINQEALQTLKLCRLQGDQLQVSYGGWLLAGHSQPEMANIQCARFKGEDVGSFIDQKQFSGPLYSQVQSAMAFAQTHIEMSGEINGLQRDDHYRFPLGAIREALVNAMIHRDYSISGSNIKFAIFDSRIEVTSPGALPKAMVISDLSSGRSEVRNKVLARFFKEIRFIEQWGTGIARMTKACLDHGLKPPKFQETGLFFKVIFSKKKKNSTAWKDQLLELLEEKPSISAEQCADVLNKSSRTIERQLAKFREDKMISRKGGTRGVWIVHS
jgi:ATP-dependent DNA helicase RecG